MYMYIFAELTTIVPLGLYQVWFCSEVSAINTDITAFHLLLLLHNVSAFTAHLPVPLNFYVSFL